MNITLEFVGTICETTCKFVKYKNYQKISESDYVAIMDVGAYGAALSSEYNTRPLVPEIMVYKERYEIVRSRPTYEEIFDKEVIPNWEWNSLSVK